MRVLRMTTYPAMGVEPTHVILRDRDLKAPVEEIAAGGGDYGILVLHDIFTMEDGSLEGAVFAAMERFQKRARREQDMAILFHYDATALTQVRPGGLLAATVNAPLSADEIRVVFRQLAEHPNYRGQTVRITSESGEEVILRDGNVS